MKISIFCFKACGTCLVLVIALSIVGGIRSVAGLTGLSGIWGVVSAFAIFGGIFLTVAVIAAIWEDGTDKREH